MSGTIHVRRSDQKHSVQFALSQVTPDFLKDVFELKYLPKYFKTESSGLAVKILPSTLVPNEYYIIKGPGPAIGRRNGRMLNRDGK